MMNDERRKVVLKGLGARIRSARLSQRLTLRALEEKSGVSNAQICSIELGRHDPGVTTLMKLAEALGMSPNHIIPGCTP